MHGLGCAPCELDVVRVSEAAQVIDRLEVLGHPQQPREPAKTRDCHKQADDHDLGLAHAR
jgi:hypothetical protein